MLMNKTVFRLGELFCGPGGLAIGALRSQSDDGRFSVTHVWANDYDLDTCQTYRYNICPNDMDSVKESVHSHNLYQIFAYVKNKDTAGDKSVSGMLLYAKTEGTNPDATWMMDGNKISAKYLDLDCDFKQVSEQLDGIVNDWLKDNDLECEKTV